MNILNLQAELRSRLATLSAKTAASCAQGMTDLPKQAEDLVAGLLRELLGYRNIRNLNTGAGNFPGLDLADDERRTAFQVTATTSLDKVKQSLSTVIDHGLHEQYPDLRFFILTTRQDSYSQPAIDKVVGGRFKFVAEDAIWDYRDLLRKATHASPVALQRAIEVFDAYDAGALESLAAADFDPPPRVAETVEANLVELYFPQELYLADLLDRPAARGNGRKHARKSAKALQLTLPSDFEVFEGKILTFHNLDSDAHPFPGLLDKGTTTAIASKEFWRIDADHERVFKSLLRFGLQQQVYRKRVGWFHEEGLFVFLPEEGKLERIEAWTDKKSNTRTVVIYKASKRDPSKGGFRHLAFQADFVRASDEWFIALRPDWYFSTNPDYRPSPIGSKLMTGLKRLENNKSVEQHFRFLWRWLQSQSEGDLWTDKSGYLSFGEIKTFDTHPALDDDRWRPLKTEPVDVDADAPPEIAELMLQ